MDLIWTLVSPLRMQPVSAGGSAQHDDQHSTGLDRRRRPVFKDSLSSSTQLSLHRQRSARDSTTTGRERHESWFNGENGQHPLHSIASVVYKLSKDYTLSQ